MNILAECLERVLSLNQQTIGHVLQVNNVQKNPHHIPDSSNFYVLTALDSSLQALSTLISEEWEQDII